MSAISIIYSFTCLLYLFIYLNISCTRAKPVKLTTTNIHVPTHVRQRNKIEQLYDREIKVLVDVNETAGAVVVAQAETAEVSPNVQL